MNRATVVRIEDNEPGVKRETYERVAVAFGITLADLFALVPKETHRAHATPVASGERRFHADAASERRTTDIGPPLGKPDRRRSQEAMNE